MRILQVVVRRFSFLHGERVVRRQTSWLRRAGANCDYAMVRAFTGPGEQLEPEIRPELELDWPRAYNPLQIWRTARALRRPAYDVLHFHAWGGREALLKRLVRGRARIVTTLHGYVTEDSANPYSPRQWARMAAAASDCVVVNSQFMEGWLRAHAGDAARLTVRVIPNGIDLDEYRPSGSAGEVRRRLRESWGFPRDAFVIGVFARLLREKGVADALSAAAPLLRSGDGFRLAVAGEGPEEAALRGWISAQQLDGRVRFLGWRRDVADCLEACDVLLHATRVEAFGLAVLEAMALGRPVVAYNVGGIPELLTDGEAGCLAPLGDEAALRQAVAKLAADEGLRRRMGEAGRARARAYSADRVAAALKALYESLG